VTEEWAAWEEWTSNKFSKIKEGGYTVAALFNLETRLITLNKIL
jgi:hypothetical protein